jgi:aspartate 1-decarboxylase
LRASPSAEVFRVLLTLCKSKLHRATVTQANLHYMGSITIDADLMAAAGILPFERVQVVDVANGARFETYAVGGDAGSGTICVNGAAARLVHVGDPVIVISYAQMTPEEARAHRPVIVLLKPDNGVLDTLRPDPGTEPAEPSDALDA